MRNPARSAVSAVDPVELGQPVAVRLDDPDAAGPRLVHVLAPLLAQVGLQRVLVGARGRSPGCDAGWIGGAGRQPAARRAWRSAPPSSSGPSVLDLGVDPQVADAAGPRPAGRARTASVNASIPSRGPGRWSPGRAARRRSPTAAAPAGGPGPARRSTGRPAPSTRRRRQPLTALTRAQAASWRYEPGSAASTERVPGGVVEQRGSSPAGIDIGAPGVRRRR